MVHLTRYLYEITRVELSLQWALVHRQRDEALFWAYEAYHSGFQERIFNFLWQFYQDLYHERSPHLAPILLHLYSLCDENNDTLLGSWVLHLLASPISLAHLMRGDTVVIDMETPHNILLSADLLLSPEECLVYQTVTAIEHVPPRKWLAHLCRFPQKNIVPLLPNASREERRQLDQSHAFLVGSKTTDVYTACDDAPLEYNLYNHWLYYASHTPIWEKRIRDYHGVVDDDAMTVVFDDDDDLEGFYSTWGMEPDEQSQETNAKFMIRTVDQEMPWRTFCKLYGGEW